MLGWVTAGKFTPSCAEEENMFFMNSSQNAFAQMCCQEVLGLKDFENVHDSFHEDFIDQLQRLEEDTCTYCTSLPWKQGTDSREIKKCHAKAGEDAEI